MTLKKFLEIKIFSCQSILGFHQPSQLGGTYNWIPNI